MPLEKYLQRRRRSRWLYAAVGVVLLLAALSAERDAGRLAHAERVELRVVEVIDAGTLRLNRPGGSEADAFLVRLAGIDIDGPWAAGCEQAIIDHTRQAGVRITWRQRMPRSGGEAYVYLADGTLLNETLIEAGHARAAAGRSVASTHALTPWFERVERRAAQSDRGLWTELNLAELDDGG